MPDKELDIQSVIERGVSKTTLDSLQKKGVQNVKVIRENQINELITSAVDSVIDTRIAELATTVDDEDRDQIIKESQQEFKRLLAETQKIKKEGSKIRKEDEKLQSEIKVLKRQVQLQKEILNDEYTRGFEEGKGEAADGGEADAELQREFETKVADIESQNSDLKNQVMTLQGKVMEVQDSSAAQGKTDQEAKNQLKGEIETLQKENADLLAQVERLEEPPAVEVTTEAVSAPEGMDEAKRKEVEAALQMASEALAKVEGTEQAEAISALKGKIETMMSHGVDTTSKLETMLSEMTDKITDEISKRMVVGTGSGSTAVDPGAVEVQDVMLDNLFKDSKLESNVGSVGVKQRKSVGKGVGGSLAKLRAMRGGGEKKEEKEKEKK